jgi:hypothetical protein
MFCRKLHGEIITLLVLTVSKMSLGMFFEWPLKCFPVDMNLLEITGI